MPIQINSIISTLDKPTSLTPFFVKDAFDITGRTVMAQNESGKHEAREKFIEEAGTSLFWIGGIPAGRWIGEKIVKAYSKIDPKIHFKRINTEGIQNYFADEIVESGKKKFDTTGIQLKGSKLNKIKTSLKKTEYIVNGTKGGYKKAHIGITAASVLTNLVILSVGLPKFNQYLSRRIIAKEEQQKLKNIKARKATNQYPDNVLNKNQNKKDIPFKGFLNIKKLFNFTDMAENAQLNITSSMLLLDYGISGSRVTFIPRDNNERIENAVKEGGIILFFYHAADWIKKGLSHVANKGFNTPIDLDYKIITDKNFVKTLKKESDKDELFKFAQSNSEIDIIKFIDKELDNVKELDKNKIFKNFTLQEAQKAGLIDIELDETIGKWIRHSEKYIETDKIADLNKNLKTFWEKATDSGKIDLEKIISKTKKVKAASVLANMAICCVSLSYVLPKIQYIIREHRTKTKAAPGIKVYQDLAAANKLKV